MDEPYHKELYDILIKKGWKYCRVKRSKSLSYDLYLDKFNDRRILFYEDESMQSFEKGLSMKIKDFDNITNNIFAEGV